MQGRGAGATGLRNDIQKCLREHTEGVGEYQFAKARKVMSEWGTAETKAAAASSVWEMPRGYVPTCRMRTNFAPGGYLVRGTTQPICEKWQTSSNIRAWEYPLTEGRVPLSMLNTKRRSVLVGWRLKRRIKRSTMHERTMTVAAKMLESVTGLWEPAGRGSEERSALRDCRHASKTGERGIA